MIENNSQTLAALKVHLHDYLAKRRNLFPNYDLGDFGRSLGYAQTITAFILALIVIL